MTATFTLNQNDVVKIVVGQRGLTALGEDTVKNNYYHAGGGGGGSFVVKQDGTILVIAGGGGGGSGDCYGWVMDTTAACLNANTGSSGGFTYSSGLGRGTNGQGGAAGE